MTTPTLPPAVIVSLALYLLTRFLTLPHDSKEPPLIPSKIPVIGHVIGLFSPWDGVLLQDGVGH